jgi:hypothetical protein
MEEERRIINGEISAIVDLALLIIRNREASRRRQFQ